MAYMLKGQGIEALTELFVNQWGVAIVSLQLAQGEPVREGYIYGLVVGYLSYIEGMTWARLVCRC